MKKHHFINEIQGDFKNIYHLQGGILNYLEKINEENSLWDGECFVFDDRVALNHKLEVGSYDMCHGCRMPITNFDKDSEHYERGVSCPNCFNKKTPDQKNDMLTGKNRLI